MSALAGIVDVTGRPLDPTDLARMLETMAHRGPDRAGSWIEGPIGFGHRLLRVTPASHSETQPLVSENRNLIVVYDGRLDNRAELQTALKAHGLTLQTDSDPELILKSYESWGLACPTHLLGDFAFAVWDRQYQRLFCARDPIGVKPFYYHWDGTRLFFASEVKAILANPTIPKRPNDSTILDYLLMEFRDPAATFFEGINQLKPAHTLCLEDGRIVVRRYWDADALSQLRYRQQEEYEVRFRDLFEEAVRCRLASAGPVGILLSGGIDSTAITAMAEAIRRRETPRRLLPRTSSGALSNGHVPQLSAFTLLARGFSREDWRAIEQLTTTYGTKLHTVYPERPDDPLLVLHLAFHPHTEVPSYNGLSALPELLRPAGVRGCRAMITGFGANELTVPSELGFLEDLLLSGQFRRFAHETTRYQKTYSWPPPFWSVVLSTLWNQLSPEIQRRIKQPLGRQVPSWVKPTFATRTRLNGWQKHATPHRFPTWSQQETYRALTRPWMSFSLDHFDEGAARCSFEYRYPFLDQRLIEFFLAIPPQVKMHAGFRKSFIQQALREIVPGPIRFEEDPTELIPSKSSPVDLEVEARGIQHELFRQPAQIFDYVDRVRVHQLLKAQQQGRLPLRYRNLFWRFVGLEWWLREWFDS